MIVIEISKRTKAICMFVYKVTVMSSVVVLLMYCSFLLVDTIGGK
jgi:hypothetical protein